MAGVVLPGRRSIILLVVALLVATAGCAGVLDSGDADGDDASLVEYAPAGSEFLVHVDGDVVHDDETQALLDEALQAAGEEQTSDELLDEATDDAAVDPTSIDQVLIFGQESEGDLNEESAGVVLATDWTDSEFATVLEEDDTEHETTTHAGHTLYVETGVQDPSYVGVIEEGTYVFGDEASVKGALEVADGQTDSVSGPIREEYDAASGGLITMVVSAPEDESGTAGQAVDQFEDVQVVSWTYDTPSGSIETDLTYVFPDSSSASAAGEELSTGLDAYSSNADSEVMTEALDNVDVETDDDRVSIVYEDDVDSFATTAATIWTAFVEGFGSPDGPRAPAVQFDWETRDGDAVATHYGGDTLQADRISAHDENGERLPITTTAEDGTIQTGDEIVIEGGASADRIRITWASEGDSRVTIGSFSPSSQ